jgi:hypothetical protein
MIFTSASASVNIIYLGTIDPYINLNKVNNCILYLLNADWDLWISYTTFLLPINFGFEIRFSIKSGLRSHLFRIKCVFVFPNSNHLGVVVWNLMWIKSYLKPAAWTQNKIYFRIKSIMHFCRTKSMCIFA